MNGIGISTGVPSTKGPQIVQNFTSMDVTVADQDFRLSGVTLDSAGAVLGGCTVHLYMTSTDMHANTQVSDPVTGAYSMFVQPLVTYYAVAYKAGAPDVAGTTVNTLVGV